MAEPVPGRALTAHPLNRLRAFFPPKQTNPLLTLCLEGSFVRFKLFSERLCMNAQLHQVGAAPEAMYFQNVPSLGVPKFLHPGGNGTVIFGMGERNAFW